MPDTKKMIKLGRYGWADKVDALGVKYDGGNGCWLYSSLEKDIHHMLLQSQARHAMAWHRVFAPFEGQKGLLFSGGHKPEKYELKATASYGGIHFVADDNPERHRNNERDLPLRERKT